MTAPHFNRISHDAFTDAIGVIAGQLGGDGWSPTLLVGVGRGGLAPAVYLSHASGLPMVSIDFSTPVAEFNAVLIGALAARTREGEHLLFVEDINDSGRTIASLRSQMANASAIADRVRYAVLIDNCASVQPVDYRAQTIDRRITKDWFVFPWEAVAPDQSLLDDAAELPDRIA